MKIKLKIQGKEKELTLDEAREVYNELQLLFGEKEIVYVPTYPIYPTYPTYPTITFTSTSDYLADEKLLGRDWNSPDEDKAWKGM